MLIEYAICVWLQLKNGLTNINPYDMLNMCLRAMTKYLRHLKTFEFHNIFLYNDAFAKIQYTEQT